MKRIFFFLACVLMGVSAKAQIVDVSVYDDCSRNGYTKTITAAGPTDGSAEVLSTSGRTSCEYVQLWENGPKWATFNVGATITDYANLTIGADATPFNDYTDQAPYYNTANCGGLYAWNQPNYNGRKTTWTSSVTTGVADVATALWGSNWKTPTYEQLDTLQNSSYGKTTRTWCNGTTTQFVPGCTLKGYKVSGVGAYADKSIFLPAAGYFSCLDGAVDLASYYSDYWSSTLYDSVYVYCLSFYSSNRYMARSYREPGLSVRAVLVVNAPQTKPLPYVEPFSANQGEFSIQDVTLDGLGYVWQFTTNYGMKASAYVGGVNHATDSWLISPRLEFPADATITMTFDHVHRYTTTPQTDLTLLISEDYVKGAPSTATWTQVTIPTYAPGSNWTFVNAGAINLSSFAGKNVTLAFRYKSSASAAATWEIKNVSVTSSSITTGVDEILNLNNASKCMIDGHLFILRDGHKYTATGTMIE